METARQTYDKNQEMVVILERIIRYNYFSELKSSIEKKFAQALLTSGKYLLVYGRHHNARAYFFRSFRIVSSAKAIAGIILSIPPFVMLFRCLTRFATYAKRVLSN